MAAGLEKWVAVCVATVIASIPAYGQGKPAPETNCHARIATLADASFSGQSREQLQEIHKFLFACIAYHAATLSKVAAVNAAMELESLWEALDKSREEASAAIPLPSDAVIVKISPLQVGSIFYITFASVGHTCEVKTTADIWCKYYPGGSHYDYSTQKNELDFAYRRFVGAVLANKGTSYAIGCVEGDHACLRPRYGETWAVMEGTTIRFPAGNVEWTDHESGRKVDEQPALFTLLGRLPNQ